MSYRDVGALLEVLPFPLLLLDTEGRLLDASAMARELLPDVLALRGRPFGEALEDPNRWAQRLRESQATSNPLPARIAWRAGYGSVALSASVHFIAPRGERLGCYLVTLRPQVEAAHRFIALKEQLQQLDAEMARRDRAEEILRDREAWLRVVLQSIADAVITTDAEAKITSMNPAAEVLTGWPLAQAMGRPIQLVMDLVHEDTIRAAPNPVVAAMQERRATGMLDDAVLLRRDGTSIAVEDTAAPIFDDRGRLVGGVIVFHDVTEKRRLVREMAERATHDPLTGLFNRFEFDIQLGRALDSAKTHGHEHCLLYIDLDHFKVVNDTSGHSVGDRLLREVVGLLQASVRASDLIARLGGDEFGVLLPHCGLDAGQRVAEAIHQRLEEFRFENEGRRFRIGASIGLALIDGHWRDCEVLMQAADTACYAAKESGGHQTHLWHEEGGAADVRGRMVWVQRITDALEDHRFELHLQRVETLREDRGPVHVEALLRLRDDDGLLIAPGEFLPAAERFNLVTAIDRWVLGQVVLALRQEPGALVQVAVNFSGQSIGDRAFRDEVLGLLREAGPSTAKRLCIEITETAAVSHLGEAARFMGHLREIGVEVALDDFGAGSSSFGYLRHLPIDWLKIDGQFVEGLPSDRLGATAVRCFVEAAHVVGARSIAERVENAEALQTLRLLGVDRVQGYHLHRPEPWSTVWATLPRVGPIRGVL